MNKITTIKQLLHQLSESSDEQLKSIYKFLKIPTEEFTPYLHFSKEYYTRNCIVKTDRYELILICWEKDQFQLAASLLRKICLMGIFPRLQIPHHQELWEARDRIVLQTFLKGLPSKVMAY